MPISEGWRTEDKVGKVMAGRGSDNLKRSVWRRKKTSSIRQGRRSIQSPGFGREFGKVSRKRTAAQWSCFPGPARLDGGEGGGARSDRGSIKGGTGDRGLASGQHAPGRGIPRSRIARIGECPNLSVCWMVKSAQRQEPNLPHMASFAPLPWLVLI
jgi:hypothetical protein